MELEWVFLADDILEAIVTLTGVPPIGPTIWGLGSSFRGASGPLSPVAAAAASNAPRAATIRPSA